MTSAHSLPADRRERSSRARGPTERLQLRRDATREQPLSTDASAIACEQTPTVERYGGEAWPDRREPLPRPALETGDERALFALSNKSDPRAGAVVTFQGVTREVDSLEYEAYEEHAVPRLAAVADEVRARWPEVAGSIAGDDTLFVAFPDRGSLQRIKRRLVRLAE
mgnify:CR=1 FL=1